MSSSTWDMLVNVLSVALSSNRILFSTRLISCGVVVAVDALPLPLPMDPADGACDVMAHLYTVGELLEDGIGDG